MPSATESAQSAGLDRAKIAAALVLLGPFVPMLFQGEEWAASSPFLYFADHQDQELARLVSEGRRREFAAFGWDPAKIPDPESREAFERSKLKWDELAAPAHAEMLDLVSRADSLRRSTPSLNNGEPGNTYVTYSEEQKWLWVRPWTNRRSLATCVRTPDYCHVSEAPNCCLLHNQAHHRGCRDRSPAWMRPLFFDRTSNV